MSVNNWRYKFSRDNIFFVTPDVKRGIGVEHLLPNYHIICSYINPLIPILRKQGARIFCLEEKAGKGKDLINNSGKLLEHPLVNKYIKEYAKTTPYIMYFKPSLKLDLLIRKLNYRPIGNNADLNEEFENKIKFYHVTEKYLPKVTIPSIVGILGKLNYKDLSSKLGLPLVIQFGHGWAGKTTFFIDNEKEFHGLSRQFSQTNVKVSRKITGITILNNCCIYNDYIFVSPAAIQLSGIRQLSSRPGVTCGRQWPAGFIEERQTKEILNISKKIGKIMQEKGFRGFFGLDFIIENSTGKIYLSEANARLTASTPFFTRLELGLEKIPLLAYHLAAFTNRILPQAGFVGPEISGSQVLFRETKYIPMVPDEADFGVFMTENDKVTLVNNEYYPENLHPNEFIFIRNNSERFTNDQEIARIETKQEILDQPGKLAAWIQSILHK